MKAIAWRYIVSTFSTRNFALETRMAQHALLGRGASIVQFSGDPLRLRSVVTQ